MSKKILIAGGLGYLGVMLTNHLTKNHNLLRWSNEPSKISEITLLDIVDDSPNKEMLFENHDVIIANLFDPTNIYKIAEKDQHGHVYHPAGELKHTHPNMGDPVEKKLYVP